MREMIENQDLTRKDNKINVLWLHTTQHNITFS